MGVLVSPATSTMAREPGVTEVPITTSTLSSVISLRILRTATVVSVASSRTMYSIFWPATSVGSRLTVLRSGMPSEAAGPVAATVTPTLICADTATGRLKARAAANVVRRPVVMQFILFSQILFIVVDRFNGQKIVIQIITSRYQKRIKSRGFQILVFTLNIKSLNSALTKVIAHELSALPCHFL